MRAIIFANGQMKNLSPTVIPIQAEDLIIAADGGLRFCTMHDIVPHLIVGDLDSVDHTQLKDIKKQGCEIIQYPVDKDATDLELSITAALNRGAQEILILSALGGRWDMTFSNILLMASDLVDGVHVRLLDGTQEIFCIKGAAKVMLIDRDGANLSLLPLSPSVNGITLKGMKYPLKNESLCLGTSRGLSNIVLNSRATILVDQGILLAVLG